MDMKTTLQIILTLAIAAVAGLVGWHARPDCPVIETRSDTVIVRDTILVPVPVPVERHVVRVDTVRLTTPGDTVRVEVEIPIERKVYATSDYRAEIEGFRPQLISMEVYRQTQFIDRTQTIRVPDTKRWGFGVNIGAGYAPNMNKVYPTISVGVQYNLIEF
jgi:hypothetical protein